jgi:hypothetical protein
MHDAEKAALIPPSFGIYLPDSKQKGTQYRKGRERKSDESSMIRALCQVLYTQPWKAGNIIFIFQPGILRLKEG